MKNLLEIKELRRFLIICLYVLCLVLLFSGSPWVFNILQIIVPIIILLPIYYLYKYGYGYMILINRILLTFLGPFFILNLIFFEFFGGIEYFILKLSISGIISVITFIYFEKILSFFDSIFDLNFKSLFKKFRNRIFYGIPAKLKSNLKQFNTEVFNTISNADELKKYADLKDQGIITEEEFQAKKKKLLD